MSGELAEDWCIEDPNEEWYNPTGAPKGTWMPEGSVILELLERIQKEKVFELKWKCPGRRPPPSAEVEEEMEAEEEEEEEDWAEEQPADKSAGFGEFDFDDAPSEVSAKITPRRTPGAGKSPRPQKRVARMDDVLNKIMTQRRQSEAARVSKGLGVRGRRTPIYSTGSPRSRFGTSLFKQKPSPFQLHKMSSQLKSPVPSAKAGPKPPGGAMPMEVDGNVDTPLSKAPLETAQPRVHTQIPVTTTALQNVDNSSSKAEITSVMESRASVHDTTPLVAAASSAATTVTTAVSTPKSNPVPTTKHETPVEYREPIPKLLLKIPPKSTNQPATSMILPPGHSRTSHGSHTKKPPANQALGQQDSHSLKTQNQIPPEHVNQPKTPQPYARAQPQQGTPKTPPLYPGPPRTPPLYQGPPRTPPLQHKPNTPPAAHGSGQNSQLHQYTQQYAQQTPAAAHSGRPAQSGARTPPVSMHAPGIMSSLGQTERSSGSGAFMTGGQNVSPVINTGPKTPTSLSGGSKTPPFIGAPAGFSGGPKTPPFMNAPMSGGSSAKTPPVMVRSPNVPRTVSGGPKASPGIASSPLSYPTMGTGPTTSPLTSGSNPSLGMPGPHMLPAFPGGPKTPPALGSGPKVHVGHGRSKTPPANMSGQRTPPAFQSGPKTPPAYAQAAKGNPFFQQQMLQSLANAHNQRSGGGNQGQPPSSSPQRLHSPQSAQWSAPSGQYPPRSAPSPSQHPPQRSVPSPGQQFSPHSIPSPSPQFSPRSLQSPLGSPRAPHGQIIQSPPRSTPHSPHSAGAPPRSPFHLNFPLPGFDQGQIRDAIQQQQQHVLQQHAIQLQKQQKQQHLQHQLQQQQHGQPSPQHQTRPKTPPAYPGTIARPQFPPSRPPPPLSSAATPPVNRPPGPRFRHETHPVSSTGQQRPLHPIPHSTQTAQPAHLNQSMSLHTSRPPLPANQHQSSGRVTDQGNGSG